MRKRTWNALLRIASGAVTRDACAYRELDRIVAWRKKRRAAKGALIGTAREALVFVRGERGSGASTFFR